MLWNGGIGRVIAAGAALAAYLIGGAPAWAEEAYTMKAYSVEDTVIATDASADASRVLFVGADGVTRILDTANSLQVSSITWPGVTAYTATFSPDGASILLFAPDKGIGIWDTASGKNRLMLSPPERLNGLSWSADGRFLTGPGISGTPSLFDAATGQEAGTLMPADTQDAAISAELSPDGTALLSVSLGRYIQLWDVRSGKPGLRVSRDDHIKAAHWSPDGKRIVLSLGNDTAEIVDAATGTAVLTLRGHTDDVLDARYSPDGTRLVTGSYDKTARVWAADGSLVATLTGHYNEVAGVTFAPDSRTVITFANDARIRVWSPAAPGAAPEGAEGLWRYAFDTDEELPDEITRFSCLNQPTVVGKQGLIVMFDMGGENEPPQPTQTLRCTAAGACKMFPGAPGQSQEPFGDGTFSLKDGRASLCNGEQCVTLDRCKAIAWTEEEKASGYSARWEATVLGSIKDN